MLAPSLAWLRRLPHRLARLLPCQCALCGDLAPEPICPSCKDQFFNSHASRCFRCGTRLPHALTATECAVCLRAPPAFDASIIATDYVAPVDQLVLALKFGRQLPLAPAMSELLRRAFEHAGALRPDVLIAVPLGSQRLAERGFNQSFELARSLAKAWEVPLERQGTVRQRETPPQSLLAPEERRKNIRRAFTVPHTEVSKIKGRHVVVVDDVMTTGATLNELAFTLKRFGAARVTNLVFARALAP